MGGGGWGVVEELVDYMFFKRDSKQMLGLARKRRKCAKF